MRKTDHAADTDGHVGVADVKLVGSAGAGSAGAGEIYARGPQMLVDTTIPRMTPNPSMPRATFAPGIFAGWVDAEYLVVTGQAKDIIIRNGENIAPKEVEDILTGHPGIAEIAIVGLPDPRTGERACAVVVPATTPGPDVESLRSFLHESGMAKFKAPEQVVLGTSSRKTTREKY